MTLLLPAFSLALDPPAQDTLCCIKLMQGKDVDCSSFGFNYDDCVQINEEWTNKEQEFYNQYNTKSQIEKEQQKPILPVIYTNTTPKSPYSLTYTILIAIILVALGVYAIKHTRSNLLKK